jgi:gamma-glutamyltranspeptidase/glutathione hydrolase
MKRIFCTLLIVSLFATSALANTARSTHGMVVTIHPIATQTGVDAMKHGGNAIDAALAAALTLGVVDGHNSGIGGGCFILIHTADGKNIAIDGRETAPAAATRDMYIRNGQADTSLSQTGPLASGVPGALAAYADASERFGKLPLKQLLSPAADIAETGFAIDQNYAKKITATFADIKKFDATARILLKPDGTPLAAGDILKQPDLAHTYREIGEHGIDYFYRGQFAESVSDWMKNNGGILRASDFADYKSRAREPLITKYRGHTIIGFPPPSSGGVHVAQILNILDRFDLKKLERTEPATRVHVMADAMKLAFADRAYWLGDPDFAKVPRGLIDADYGRQLSQKISFDRALGQIEHGTPPDLQNTFGKHTTHIAACDDQGNWVAITQTINTSFGSKVIVPGTGVLLNNEMDDFSTQPGVPNHFNLIGGEANAIAPGKRPLSSMSPTIVLDRNGKPMMTVGAAGGPKIITQVLLVVSNVIDLGDDLPRAMERPRFHHQWSPDVLNIENTFDPILLEKLGSMGHKLEIVEPVGATQAIMRVGDEFIGVSEPRANGRAAGIDR